MTLPAGRALSVRQPWAWAICHGWKDIENRTWRSGFVTPGGYGILRAFPDAGGTSACTSSAPPRPAYRAIGSHTVISTAPRSIRCAFLAVFQPLVPGSDR